MPPTAALRSGGPRPLTSLPRPRLQAVRRFVGGFYLTMAGVNAGITIADPPTYEHFADGAALPFVRDAWEDGPGIWLWSLPVLVVLTPFVRAEWPLLARET